MCLLAKDPSPEASEKLTELKRILTIEEISMTQQISRYHDGWSSDNADLDAYLAKAGQETSPEDVINIEIPRTDALYELPHGRSAAALLSLAYWLHTRELAEDPAHQEE